VKRKNGSTLKERTRRKRKGGGETKCSINQNMAGGLLIEVLMKKQKGGSTGDPKKTISHSQKFQGEKKVKLSPEGELPDIREGQEGKGGGKGGGQFGGFRPDPLKGSCVLWQDMWTI